MQQYNKEENLMDKKQAKILKLDIKNFDVVTRTVTFDFELKRAYYGGELIGKRHCLQEGNAIIRVRDQYTPKQERTAEEMCKLTKVVWYSLDSVEIHSTVEYLDTDEELKDEMRRIAYDVIHEIIGAW